MRNITKIFVKLLVFFAVTGIIFILTLINTKLLLFLNWYKIGSGYDFYFALISGIAYALGSISVLIWYNPKLKQDATEHEKKQFTLKYIGSVILKIAFVTLDGIHVYIYQNTNVDNTTIPEIASIVFAFQTILIMYFIGSVVDSILRNPTKKETDFEYLQSELQNKETDFDNLKSDFRDAQHYINVAKDELELSSTQYELLETDIALKKSELNILKTEFSGIKTALFHVKESNENLNTKIKEKDNHIEMLEKYYFKSEKSRILKKNEANRTEEEIGILQEAEQRSKEEVSTQ